jgi:hypothetical protein
MKLWLLRSVPNPHDGSLIVMPAFDVANRSPD